jgi:hypothetical protein
VDINSYLARNGIKVPTLPNSGDLARPLSDYLNSVVREALDINQFWNLTDFLAFLDEGYNNSLLSTLHLETLNGRVGKCCFSTNCAHTNSERLWMTG